jgi:hypothetical protein
MITLISGPKEGIVFYSSSQILMKLAIQHKIVTYLNAKIHFKHSSVI